MKWTAHLLFMMSALTSVACDEVRASVLPSELSKAVGREFRRLTDCESKLIAAVVEGNTAQCLASPPKKAPEVRSLGAIDRSQVVRAALVRWLLVEKEARSRVDPKGIHIAGAFIDGRLDLRFLIIPFPLSIENSYISDGLDISGSRMQELDLDESLVKDVIAENALFQGNWSLEGAHVIEQVDAINTLVGGDFVCSGALVEGTKNVSLYADRLTVNGNALLRKRFTAHEAIRLRGAEIKGALDFDTSILTSRSGLAISADGAKLAGGVYLRAAKVLGEVSFVGAAVEHNIELDGGNFSNPGGDALAFQNVRVSGNIYHRAGAITMGVVNLRSAEVKEELQLENPDDDWRIDLSYARAGPFMDNPKSWPKTGNLDLNGFVYGELHTGSDTATSRLMWLARQSPDEFRPQPYQQLARILRENGDDSGATDVLIAMEDNRLAHGKLNRGERIWQRVQGVTIGYGYKPGKAGWFISVLTIIGAVIFSLAYRKGWIVAVKEDEVSRGLPFNGFIYSLENLLPFVNLGHSSQWQPNSSESRNGVLVRYYLWVHILLGWFFASMLVAGLSGLVRKG